MSEKMIKKVYSIIYDKDEPLEDKFTLFTNRFLTPHTMVKKISRAFKKKTKITVIIEEQ